MNSLYKIVIPKVSIYPERVFHCDLAKIAMVTDAEFVDRMGHGGYYAEFKVWFQLMNEPVTFSIYQENVHGTGIDRSYPVMGARLPKQVEMMQKVVDDLRRAWGTYNRSKE